jgi:hypothetical protein
MPFADAQPGFDPPAFGPPAFGPPSSFEPPAPPAGKAPRSRSGRRAPEPPPPPSTAPFADPPHGPIGEVPFGGPPFVEPPAARTDAVSPPPSGPRRTRKPRNVPAPRAQLTDATVEISATELIELGPSTSDTLGAPPARRTAGPGFDGPGVPGGPPPGRPDPDRRPPTGPGRADSGRHGSTGGRHERPRRSFKVVGIFVLVIGAIAGGYLGLHKVHSSTPPVSAAADGAGGANGPVIDPARAKAIADAKDRAATAALSLADQNRRATEVAGRQQQETSRSGTRTDVPASCNSYTGNRALGCALLLEAGYGLDQMPCLDKLWTRESNWTISSENKSSGAYGIPQALPGDKMAAYGSDWRTNAVPQIRWGLNYIKSRYSTPCGAWDHSQATGWY